MSQWDYKIDQPIPGPFPFPNLRKGPWLEVGTILNFGTYCLQHTANKTKGSKCKIYH